MINNAAQQSFVHKVDEYSNYRFLCDFTSPDNPGIEFSIQGSEILVNGCNIETALHMNPDLFHLCSGAAPSSRPERYALRIEPLGLRYIVVYLQWSLGVQLPLQILDHRGRYLRDSHMEATFFSLAPYHFIQFFERDVLPDIPPPITTRQLIHVLKDDSISHFAILPDRETMHVYRFEHNCYISSEMKIPQQT